MKKIIILSLAFFLCYIAYNIKDTAEISTIIEPQKEIILKKKEERKIQKLVEEKIVPAKKKIIPISKNHMIKKHYEQMLGKDHQIEISLISRDNEKKQEIHLVSLLSPEGRSSQFNILVDSQNGKVLKTFNRSIGEGSSEKNFNRYTLVPFQNPSE